MQLQKAFVNEQVSAAPPCGHWGLMNADSFDIDDVAFCSSVQSPSADDGAVRPQISTGTRGGALFGGGGGAQSL